MMAKETLVFIAFVETYAIIQTFADIAFVPLTVLEVLFWQMNVKQDKILWKSPVLSMFKKISASYW